MDQDSSTATGDTPATIAASLETAAGGAARLTGAVAESMAKPAPTDGFEVMLNRAHDRIGALERFASGLNLPSLAEMEARASALENFASSLIAAFNAHFGGKVDLPPAPVPGSGAAPNTGE